LPIRVSSSRRVTSYHYLQVDNNTSYIYSRQGTNEITVLRNNPYLPQSVAAAMDANGLTQIRIGRTNEEIGPARARNRTNQYRAVLGAKGEFSSDWSWDVFGQFARADYRYRLDNEVLVANYNAAVYAVEDGNGNIVCGDPATNPNLTAAQRANVQAGCVPFNPFGLGSPSAEALDYVTNSETVRNRTDLYQFAFNVAGNLFDMPAGPVPVAFGVEARRESTRAIADPFSGLFNIGNLVGYKGKQTIYEGYLEATVPLLSDVALAKSLELNGAIRQADYSSFGGSTTWKLGASWEPFDGLRFRATRSRDLRAPDLGTLFKPGFIVPRSFTNPVTGITGEIRTVSGNNPDLGPEVGDTWTVGAVINPISGLSFSMDYYDIDISNVITSVDASQIATLCLVNQIDTFCNAITFDPTNPSGISQIRQVPFNAARQKVKGIDFDFSYRSGLDAIGLPGRISIAARAAYVDTHETIPPGAATAVADLDFTVPKISWNSTIQYQLDNFTGYVQVSGFGKTKYSRTLLGPEDEGYDPGLSNSISSNRFPAYQYVNLGLSRKVGDKDQFTVYMIVNNLFDKKPPSNYFFSQSFLYDPLGRSYRVGVKAEF